MEAVAVKNKNESVLADGTLLRIEMLDEVEIDYTLGPKDTSFHEACHALAGLLGPGGLEYLTKIPKGNSLGHTKLSRADAVAAAAAHAMGCDGTSHDLHMIRLMGGNVDGALSAAHSLLSRHMKTLRAIATALEKRKKMGSSETLAIVHAVHKETQEGKLALVTITSPDGRKKKVEKRASENVIMLSESELPREMPRPANDDAMSKPADLKAA